MPEAPDGAETTDIDTGTDDLGGSGPGPPGTNAPIPTGPPPQPQATPEPTDYERRLRDEVAGYRRQYEPIARRLRELPPEQAEGVVELLDLLATDPDQARMQVAQIVGIDPRMLQQGQDQGEPEPEYVTRQELIAFQESQLEARETEGLVYDLRDEAAEAGVDPGTPAYQHLLAILEDNVAQCEADPGVEPLTVAQAAQQMLDGLETYGQQRIDEYVQGKSRGPAPAVAGGEPPSGEEPITDLKQASRAARAHLGSL